MFSFVKELDDETLVLARQLDKQQEKLMRQRVRLFLVWVGGDETKLLAWGKKHGLKNVLLAVVEPDDKTLDPWRINKLFHSTTVLLDQTRPVATLINVESGDVDTLPAALEQHFSVSLDQKD